MPDSVDPNSLSASAAARLAPVYLLWFAATGLLATYWPYHLSALGMTAAQIGLLFSARTALGVIGQPAVTRAADAFGRPVSVLRACVVLTVVIGAGLPFARSFGMNALLFWALAPAATAVVPLLDALAVRAVGVERYGRTRLWGSIGYGAMVAAFGWLARRWAHHIAGGAALALALALQCVAALGTLRLRPDAEAKLRRRTLASIEPSLPFALFLGVHALHWSGVMAWNVFHGLHEQALGFGPEWPGFAVGVAIVAEVAAFAFAHRWAGRWSIASRLRWVFAATALRWALVAVVQDPIWMVVIQLTHFFSFGVWLGAAFEDLGRFGPAARRASLQGIFAAAVFGLGGLLGSAVGGVLFDAGGGALLFGSAAGLEFLLLGRAMVRRRSTD